MSALICLVCGRLGTSVLYRDDLGACERHQREVYELAVSLNSLACKWIDSDDVLRAERQRRAPFARGGERFTAPSATATTLENTTRRALQGGPTAQRAGVRINGVWKR